MQHDFGPFSPQELERATEWLKKKSINFEIEKDQETEKSNLSNFVDLAVFRTKSNLSQVFYLKISEISDAQIKEFTDSFLNTEDESEYSRFNTEKPETNFAVVKLLKGRWMLFLYFFSSIATTVFFLIRYLKD